MNNKISNKISNKINKKLYICEKPKQGRDIARILGAKQNKGAYCEGNGACVTWCIGHLLENAEPDYYVKNLTPWHIDKLPVVPNCWHKKLVYKAKKQFTVIKQLLDKTKHVVIATDADREGEIIAREILKHCNYKGKIERLWLSALDDASIRKSLNNIKSGSFSENLYYAGLGRQRADWLIGMNMTMAASSLFSGNVSRNVSRNTRTAERVLSVGRVQTPTLKLVVDRDREIEDFKSKDYYVLLAQFKNKQNESFWAKWEASKDQMDDEGRCIDLKIIKSTIDKLDENSVVTEFKEEKKKKVPPLCLSLSELQKKASSQFGLSAKRTLSIAQSLYEKAIITYPRSDSGYLPKSQFQEASKIIAALGKIDPKLQSLIKQCDLKKQSPAWKEWDDNSPSHHGIIPTLNAKINLSNLKAEEFKIYDLIRRYYLAQFLGDYTYSKRSVIVECSTEQFKANSDTPLEQGWLRAFSNNFLSEFQKPDKILTKENLGKIPELKRRETLLLINHRIDKKKTAPPSRFTEGTLIQAMKSIGKYIKNTKLKKVLKETSGIGTVATRDSIIETLIKRGYLARKSKQLISTDKGRRLIDLMPDIVKDPAMTAKWEQDLELVSEGKLQLESFITNQIDVLNDMLNAISKRKKYMKTEETEKKVNVEAEVYECPKCGKPLRRLKNKHKDVFFWGCSSFPECRYSCDDIDEKPKFKDE